MGSFPRVTHPCATKAEAFVRLACVRHAASVRSEPGSNSQVDFQINLEIRRSVQASIHITLERTLSKMRRLFRKSKFWTSRRLRIPSIVFTFQRASDLSIRTAEAFRFTAEAGLLKHPGDAVKLFFSTVSPTYRRRFRRKARFLQQLNHRVNRFFTTSSAKPPNPSTPTKSPKLLSGGRQFLQQSNHRVNHLFLSSEQIFVRPFLRTPKELIVPSEAAASIVITSPCQPRFFRTEVLFETNLQS